MELGSVYELRHQNNTNLLPYVGKTIDFDVRKRHHKYNCNNPNSPEYNCEKYKYIRANGGWDAWYMIEIYYGSDFEQMEKDLLKANFDGYINSEQTGRTMDEWREDNKEVRLKYNAERYQTKKEEIRKYQNKKIPCKKCGAVVSRSGMACHMRTQKCINYSSAPSSSSELSSASDVA